MNYCTTTRVYVWAVTSVDIMVSVIQSDLSDSAGNITKQPHNSRHIFIQMLLNSVWCTKIRAILFQLSRSFIKLLWKAGTKYKNKKSSGEILKTVKTTAKCGFRMKELIKYCRILLNT